GRSATVLLELLLESRLHRVAVSVVWRQEVPFLAELLDHRGGNGIGIHRRRVADAEGVPRAVLSGDRIGMAARDDVQDLFLAGHLGHRNRDAGIDVADNETYLIALDELARLLYACTDIIRRVFDQQLDRPAQNAALFVKLLGGEFGTDQLALRDRGIDSGERIDQPDLYWRLSPRLNDEGRRDLHGRNGRARFQNCSTPDDSRPLRSTHPALPERFTRLLIKISMAIGG